MADVTLKIDGRTVTVPAGSTIVQAAQAADIHIPTLCYMKDCSPIGACRICMVEAEGMPKPMAACTTLVRDGMEIHTHSAKIEAYRRRTLELICENHRMDCEFCPRYANCELYSLMVEYGLDDKPFAKTYHSPKIDDSDPVLIFDSSKCVECRRCVTTCQAQGMNVLNIQGRGARAHAEPVTMLGSSACVHCGQCSAVCPTGAIYDRQNLDLLTKWLADSRTEVVACVADSTFTGIGASFAEEDGRDNTQKLAAFLRKLGFAGVYSEREGETAAAQAAADELKKAAAEGRPLILADCPSVTELIEKEYPQWKACLSGELTDPRLAFAAQYRKSAETDNVKIISIADCTAAKLLTGKGIDMALTTRDLVTLIRRLCVSRYTAVSVWKHTEGEPLNVLCAGGEETGGIYGSLLKQHGEAVKGVQADGLAAVRGVLESLSAGAQMDLVSLKACPGGCACGGGRIQWNNRKNFRGGMEEVTG